MGSSPILAIVLFIYLYIWMGEKCLSLRNIYNSVCQWSWQFLPCFWRHLKTYFYDRCVNIYIVLFQKTDMTNCQMTSTVQWCSGYHARFTRERSWVRPPVEPDGFFLKNSLPQEVDTTDKRCEDATTPRVVVAEWLRRWTRNPLGSSRAGSNPADNVLFDVCWFNSSLYHEKDWDY